MKDTVWTILAVMLSFWCCFYYEGEFIRGTPEHFEGWYDEKTGEEQQVIWIDGERYVVDLDELTMIYYEDRLTVGRCIHAVF